MTADTYVQTIAHDDGTDLVTVIVASVRGTDVTSSIIRNLSPSAYHTLLRDLTQASDDDVDTVAATWEAMT